MNPFTVDPKTGFVESKNSTVLNRHRNAFNSERKVRFLELCNEFIAKREYPDYVSICREIGIDHRTLYTHLSLDPKFADEFQEIKLALKSVFTTEIAIKAKMKMGTLANLAVLRYLENGTWNGQANINHVTDSTASKSLITGLNSVIDAEIVDNSSTLPADSKTIDSQ